MDWNWLTNTKKHQFWENYISTFSLTQQENRYVILNCITSNQNANTGKILAISAIAIIDDTINISDQLTIYIKQDKVQNDSIVTHEISTNKEEKFVEAEAIIQFLDFVKNATIVGHNVATDIDFINEALNRLKVGKLKNEYMEIKIMYHKLINNTTETELEGLDELCKTFKIKPMDRHTVYGDAYTIAQLFIILSKRLKINQ